MIDNNFELSFEFLGRTISIRYWNPSRGEISRYFALDTETTLIEDGIVPDFVIGSVYDGGDIAYLIKREHLSEFMKTHQRAHTVMCNAAFDLHVIEKVIAQKLILLLDNKQILDVALLYQLLSLATTGDLPRQHSLAFLTEKILSVHLDKNVTDNAGHEVRTNFGAYLEGDGSVNYNLIPADSIKYAALDAVATWEVHKSILAQAKKVSRSGTLLTHDIQVKAAYALAVVERSGCYLNVDKVESLRVWVQGQLVDLVTELQSYGWAPGGGSEKSYEVIIRKLESEYSFSLPRTHKTGKISSSEQHLQDHAHIPFISSYLKFHSLKKMDSTFISKLKNRQVIYPHFRVLVSTGRTASHKPNFQNWPRDQKIRECFIPRPEHKYVIADYSMIELCTLAQICLKKYGRSKMADLINQGVDLHRWFASVILATSMDQVSSDHRLYAKACNFGYAGGLGARNFLNYARSTYGITDLTYDRAKEMRSQWLAAFPEMNKYLASQPGETFGSKISVETLTGRIRANCSYTQSRNNVFQGLAADGGKKALFRLIKEGFRVVNYVHDEFVVEVPDNESLRSSVHGIESILISEMRQVCPDVRISVQVSISDCWQKP